MTNSARRRLTPENRRNQILDCAKRIIVERGLSLLTIEQLATEAEVSNPLIYKYFDTRLQILQELLVREYKVFRNSVIQNAGGRNDYRAAVRSYVETNFQQFASGDVLGILMGQPDVRSVIEETERSRHAPFFINELAKEYKIRPRLAQRLLALSSGASIAAAENYARFGGDRKEQIDQTVAFIFGGIDQLLALERR